MNIDFTKHGWEDFKYWLETDMDTALKIKELITAIKQSPFKGIGKPEPLKYGLKGFWSRRITGEHRLVYQVSGKKIRIRNVQLFNVGFIMTINKT